MPERCIDFRLLQMVGQVRSCAAVVRGAVARQLLPRFYAPAWLCVSVPAKDKTNTERLWKNARDDQPFGGPDLPTAVFFHSRDWRATEPTPREPKIDIGGIAKWASRLNDGSIRYAHSILILTSSEYSAMSMPERRSTTSCLVGAKRPSVVMWLGYSRR